MSRLLSSPTFALAALLACAALAVPTAANAGKVTVTDAGTAQAWDARRVALVIGVDTYADPDLEKLAFAGKDAQDVAAALRDPTVGGFDEVRVLTGAQATTREAILAALRQETADLQRDDTFLVYLSGHGTLTLDPLEGTRLWFLPADARLARPEERGLEVAWLEAQLTDLVPRRRVLVMDTCHNGRADGSRAALNAATRERLAGLRGEPPAPNPVAEVTESEARLYAAQYYQPAMEDRALQNGVYTHFLLQALQGDRGTADLNRDGLVDVTEAHDYAQDRTIRHTGGLQVPRAEYRIVGRESIFLSGDPRRRTQAESALVSAYNGLLASARLFVDGQSRGALPGVVSVEPGSHRLEVRTDDGRVIHTERVTVQAGQHVQLEDLLAPEPDAWTVHLGAVATHGNPVLSPVAPELEVAFAPGVRGRWRPAVYARSTLARDPAADFDPTLWDGAAATSATRGLPSAGLFLGFAAREDLLIGPVAEAGVFWRTYACDACWDTTTQARLTGLPGLRATWTPTLGKGGTALSVRYDVRAVPLLLQEPGWTVGFAHGVAVGARF